MADHVFRVALQAYHASGTPEDLEAAIRAGQRAGEPVGYLLNQRLRPARTFRSELELRVMALLPAAPGQDPGHETRRQLRRLERDGPRQRERGFPIERPPAFRWTGLKILGYTPGEVEIPPQHLWWIDPVGDLGAERFRQVLAEIERQEIPGLDVGHSKLTERDLQPLAACDFLETLLLSSAHQVSGELLADLPAGLRCLNATVTNKVLDEHLHALARFPGLTYLELSDWRASPKRSTACFETIAQLPQLTHLAAFGLRRSSAKALAQLAPLTSLHHLIAGGGALTAASFSCLAGLPNLTNLELMLTKPLEAKHLSGLRALPHLARLHLMDRERRSPLEQLAGLRDVPQVRELVVSWFTGATAAHIRELVPHLTQVTIDDV